MAKEITIAREGGGRIPLRSVKNAEGKVVGMELKVSSKQLRSATEAASPITQFMRPKGLKTNETQMPRNTYVYGMENGNDLFIGQGVDSRGRSYAQVVVRDAGRTKLYDKIVYNERDTVNAAREAWVKHGTRRR